MHQAKKEEHHYVAAHGTGPAATHDALSPQRVHCVPIRSNIAMTLAVPLARGIHPPMPCVIWPCVAFVVRLLHVHHGYHFVGPSKIRFRQTLLRSGVHFADYHREDAAIALGVRTRNQEPTSRFCFTEGVPLRKSASVSVMVTSEYVMFNGRV